MRLQNTVGFEARKEVAEAREIAKGVTGGPERTKKNSKKNRPENSVYFRRVIPYLSGMFLTVFLPLLLNVGEM